MAWLIYGEKYDCYHFGNSLLRIYWKQINKVGRQDPSTQSTSRYLFLGKKTAWRCFPEKKSSLRVSFQDVWCCFPTFWVVVVLLSHVSTQPQTQTHYYVKYNIQTQNLKPCNLKIQHLENVNRQCDVRSSFHLLLPAVNAQETKTQSFVFVPSLQQNHFWRAIICPEWGYWLFHSETFQSTASAVWEN